ncbi:MAG: Spy/CpxP family protein refolding chaperone [Candidatus Binatia bacterium]
MMARWLFTTTLALLLAAPAALSAQPPPDGPPGGPRGMRMLLGPPGGDMLGEGPGMMLPLMLRQKDLSPEQHQRMRTIMEADRSGLHTLFSDLDAANTALAAKLLAPGAIDAASLQPEVERISALRRQLMERGLQTALGVRAVLTPVQLAKVADKRARLEKLQAEMRALLDD